MSQTTLPDRPILMSAPMVNALLAGRKTQTRRLVKPQFEAHPTGRFTTVLSSTDRRKDGNIEYGKIDPEGFHYTDRGRETVLFSGKCPYQVGQRLWVRETWQHYFFGQNGVNAPGIRYRADGVMLWNPQADHVTDNKWRPSIFMPRWASRITLEIESIRVEQLQDISEEDAKAEGLTYEVTPSGRKEWTNYLDGWAFEYFAKDSFATLWESINGLGSYALNRWVWVYTFRVLLQSA